MLGVNSNNINTLILDTENKLKNKEEKNHTIENKVKIKVDEKIDNNQIKKINNKSINPNQFKFNFPNKETKVLADNKFLESIKNISPKEVRPAPRPQEMISLDIVKVNNLNSLKKDFPKIYECIITLSSYSKNDKIDISNVRKNLGIKLDIQSHLNFEQKWCKNLLKSLSQVNTEDQKVFIENLKTNFNSKIIKEGLQKSKNDPILNEFHGNKKEIFKDFLQIYYTDPILISGLNTSIDLGYGSGSVKNISQAIKFNFDDSNTKENFGSCQDLQRRVGDLMDQTKNLTNLFEIVKYRQLGGLHNYVIFTDKETKKEYQIDPWYSQKIENSIKIRDLIH